MTRPCKRRRLHDRPSAERWFPIANLVPFLNVVGLRAARAAVGEMLGTSERNVTRWHAVGGLTPWEADYVAVRLGMHPAVVWPLEWDCLDSREAADRRSDLQLEEANAA